MASNYWAKIWIEMIDDRVTATLPDSSWRRFIECILLAKELNEDGYLPDVKDMAFRLRINAESLDDDLTRLALAGLLERRESDRWFVTNFAKRQAPMSEAERTARHRDATKRKRYSNDSVTNRYTETETETETEGEGETERAAPAMPPAKPARKNPPPPPVVRYEITDRTPAGFQAQSGYQPPTELPPPDKPDPAAEERRQAVAAMANAITDVTGISARLNWHDPKAGNGVGDLAGDLLAAGYTAAQVRTSYSRDPTAGAWHWYTVHWKGKKGDPPTLKDIRETIAGATQKAAPARKLGPIERALAMLGNAPDPATT